MISKTMSTNGMKSHLVEKEQRALVAMREGRYLEAIEWFRQIIDECPGWEHGTVQHSLAGCYEDTGQLENALSCYEEALKYEPHNPIFLGGYASFLYLHGEPADAYQAYFSLIQAEGCTSEAVDSCMQALRVLIERMGLPEEQISQDLKRLAESGD